MENKKSFYISTSSGDQFLFEAEEQYGWVSIRIGTFQFELNPDHAYDIVDALTMVANDITFRSEGL
jgi:hypothetical protein